MIVNQLVGFHAGTATATAPTPPVVPLNAYQFDSLANIAVDNAGSDDLSFTSGGVFTGFDGLGAYFSDSASYATQSGLITGDFSACGWINVGGEFPGSSIVPFRLENGTDYIAIEMADSDTDGVCEVNLHWVSGVTDETLSGFTSISDTGWFFWAIVCDMGTSISFRINTAVQSESGSPPNIAGAMDLRINVDSDYSGGGSIVCDEFYLWDSDLLTAAEQGYLHNGGAGRFYDWS